MSIAQKISDAQNIPILYVVDEQERWTAGTDPISDLHNTELNDLAVIAYSSGTTGISWTESNSQEPTELGNTGP